MNVLLINSLYFVFHYLFRGIFFLKDLLIVYIFFIIYLDGDFFFKRLGSSHSNLRIEWEK